MNTGVKLSLECGFLELEFLSIEHMTIFKAFATYFQLTFLAQHIFLHIIMLLISCLPTKQRKLPIGFSFPIPWAFPYHIFWTIQFTVFIENL